MVLLILNVSDPIRESVLFSAGRPRCRFADEHELRFLLGVPAEVRRQRGRLLQDVSDAAVAAAPRGRQVTGPFLILSYFSQFVYVNSF